MLKAKDLRDQSVEELQATLVDTKKELFEILNDMKQTKKLENPHLLKQKKKNVARILTVIGEKQMPKNKEI